MSDEEDGLNPLNDASWWRKNLQQARTVEWVAEKEGLEPTEAREYLDQLVDGGPYVEDFDGPLERIEQDGTNEYILEQSVLGGEEDTIRLVKSDRLELVSPDGTTTKAYSAEVGDCTVAVASDGSFLTIFVNGTLTFTLHEKVNILSPLQRSIAITDAGYVAFHTGEHQKQIFNLVSWDGEVVLQRRVQAARSPSFTPEGAYVGFWSLSEKTIYCYDVEAAELSGSRDSTDFKDSNLSVTGVEYEGQPAFEIADSSGGTNNIVGYLAPDGKVLKLTGSD